MHKPEICFFFVVMFGEGGTDFVLLHSCLQRQNQEGTMFHLI